MKKKNFTLVELAIVLVIVGVLATLGIPAYQNTIENNKARACRLNQEVIMTAVEAYARENNRMPAVLSILPGKDLEYAWQATLKKYGWQMRLVYFLSDDERDMAFAQSGGAQLHDFIGNLAALKCPADTSGGPSYGYSAPFSSNAGNISAVSYQQLTNTTGPYATMPIIADTAERHVNHGVVGMGSGKFAVGTGVGGKHYKSSYGLSYFNVDY